MKKQKLHKVLGRVSGHLNTGVLRENQKIQWVHRSLSRSLLSEDVQQLKTSSFQFENADLLSAENISPELSQALQAVAEQCSTPSQAPEYRAFVREVPVRSTQLPASTPLWAAGAAVDHTIGPFANKDGRQFWFDFFKIEKLVALYIQGLPDPALLFKVTLRVQILDVLLPPITDAAASYKLPAGSIWINSQMLAANAPSGLFNGLTIRGGTINLSTPPSVINGKLTVAADTTVTIRLDLQQPAINGDDTSPYGADARAATLQLPTQFSVHFSGHGRAVDAVSAAQWNVYGDPAEFTWDKAAPVIYDNVLHRTLVPFRRSPSDLKVSDCRSPFYNLQGEAPVFASAWAIPVASLDVLNPTPAAGIGGMLARCGSGLTNVWLGLKGGQLNLHSPVIVVDPGRIALTDLQAGNIFCSQDFALWKDEQNPFGASIAVQYTAATPLFYNSVASGDEVLAIVGNADVRIDRPVTVTGEPLLIRSKNSTLILALSKILCYVYFFDDNILLDNTNLNQKPPSIPQPIALALHNALFKVAPVSGCALFGSLAEDFVLVTNGFLFLSFGMYAYLPTLPDPYTAKLAGLEFQFRESRAKSNIGGSVWLLLVCEVQWKPGAKGNDQVDVSFHFAPLPNQYQSALAAAFTPSSLAQPDASSLDANADVQPTTVGSTNMAREGLPDYGKLWDSQTQHFRQEVFALLDVSTNADLLGVSFGTFADREMTMVATHAPVTNQQGSGFPLQVKGMDVVSQGSNVRAFTVPQVSWEPVLNLTPSSVVGDPTAGPNYYPDDGGPTRILNNSAQQVALAPIPLTRFLVDTFKKDDKFAALALFTLPFGINALALLQKQYETEGLKRRGANILCDPKTFGGDVKGALQVELDAGEALFPDQSDMFVGSTVQINNVLELDGTALGNSTLGHDVTEIFNNEFLLQPFSLIRQRGVPLTRIDLSGYGASTFSNWLNPKASIAETSQARFNVFVGRCAHEVIQVKSILYPWGIHVVRTITLFRTGSAYAYRWDSGWRAEGDGRFDFTYFGHPALGQPAVSREADYEIHPGLIDGLFNIQEIKETTSVLPFTGQMTILSGRTYVDQNGLEQTAGTDVQFPFELQPVFFNADIEIENPLSGYRTITAAGKERKVVPSKGILGFVQLAPRGMPLTTQAFHDLVGRQGTIGGPLDTSIDINLSGQQHRVRTFDFSNSFAVNGNDPIFVAAPRGTAVLPKDGAWSLVQHLNGTGEVTPVPEDLSVPLIRIGKLVKQVDDLILEPAPATQLVRVAETTEILRAPVPTTVNYGFLHSTDTQKALFLTPAYAAGVEKMLSKTPPLFADAFRIVNSKAIFPHAGNAVSNFGDSINLAAKGTEFAKSALTDAGTPVQEIMQIDQVVAGVRQQGYQLLKNVPVFDLPSSSWTLVELAGAFKIYIEYKASTVQNSDGTTRDLTGSLDYDVNSFAANLADTWKSHMNNVALVVDLGPIQRLMTIKGNWDANKGAEAQYGGGPDFLSPQIEFAPELNPIIEILQILQELQSENYKGAFQQGLKLAMSNKAGCWEYKFEASKEIPVVRFPTPDFLYNDPNAALKLEAGLKLGMYFNAALKVTTDPKQLLPTAGAYLGFYGRLSVMCVSLSVATVYAVGQANLDIGADTLAGPSLHMKFGFGAQIVVGLPVVGNVSVLYMVGVEIFIDSVQLQVSAFLLFQGHAELLAGLVAVTITIEAKGTITRGGDRTDLAAQVTFGLDISIFLVIDINFSTSWQEQRQIA